MAAKKKILVVEDYNDIRRMMAIMLRQYGFEVVEASDGYEAVEKALKERPDLVFMDLAMPILDGVSSVKAMRAHDELKDMPIMAVTAYHDFYKDRAKDAGCNAVIQKPLHFERLQPIVNQFSR
jgi:CheY-like chemotaxis protein